MIGHVDITLALAADAMAIAELSRDAIEYGLSWRWTPRRVARSIRDSASNVVVARKGQAFAGFSIMKYEEEEAHLVLMAVAPAHRRQGVATAMWQWLELTVRTAGISSVLVESRARNEAALTFYRHLGFEDAGLYPGYYEGVEDARRLVKDMSRVSG